MILRTDVRLSKCKQRTAILASTVHEMEIVLLSLSSASPFRPSRSLFAFAYGVLLFSCHCFIQDAQFATQGGIIGRSEEHTYELQSILRLPYVGFCLQ